MRKINYLTEYGTFLVVFISVIILIILVASLVFPLVGIGYKYDGNTVPILIATMAFVIAIDHLEWHNINGKKVE
jgi:hypothetical protein